MVGFGGETKLGQVKTRFGGFLGLTVREREKKKVSRDLLHLGRDRFLYLHRANNLLTLGFYGRQLDASLLRDGAARLGGIVGGHVCRGVGDRGGCF